MDPIPGIDLKRVDENATRAFGKAAEARLADYLRGLLVSWHNIKMKSIRLRLEADQADASAEKLKARIDSIRSGDWSSVEPMDMSAGTSKEEK